MAERRRYTVIIEQGDDGWLVVHVPTLPGVWTQGRTRDEALANARDAIELTIEDMLAHGEAIPEEDAERVEVVA